MFFNYVSYMIGWDDKFKEPAYILESRKFSIAIIIVLLWLSIFAIIIVLLWLRVFFILMPFRITFYLLLVTIKYLYVYSISCFIKFNILNFIFL